MPRTADPARFPDATGAARPLALLIGASVLLGGLLMAAPREMPGVVVAVVLGGAWLSLVLAMTLPRDSERAGQELVRRLATFRHELNAVGDAPSRASLDRLLQRARELGLQEAEVSDELAQLRACVAALELKAQLARGEMPTAQPLDPLPPGDTCHFVSPVRFGRRRSDQFGHLVLTSGWLKFRGALDMSVAWSEVVSVRRDGREIVVRLEDSRRVFRFACQSATDAAIGGVIAEYLANQARPEADPTARYHASV